MKKLILLIAISVLLRPITVNAETIVIVDGNNVVKQQIYTQPMGTQVYTSQPVYTAPQPVYVQPQQVVVQQPAPQPVVVVRETVRPRSYYYDSAATAMFAGFTGAVIGNALFGHHHHGHHHHH